MSFRAKGSKSGEFTPINTSTSEWARRLAEVKITPAPERVVVAPVADEPAKDPPKPVRRKPQSRSVQLWWR
jgi:hypothetical protein